MTDSASYPPPFQLDGRLVQPDLNRITGPQGPIQIEPRVMQVLLVLVRQPQVVVPREHLLDEVWADRIVGEENLTRAISELRRIFGDDPRQPRIIETIRNHGYRLIATVQAPPTPVSVPSPTPTQPGDSLAQAQSPAAEEKISRGLPRGTNLRWLLLVILLIAAGFFWALNHGSTPPEISSPPWAGPPVPLTSYPGRERQPDLSPDGQRVAFVWSGQDLPVGCATALYVKQRNSETPLRLTGAPGWVAWPAWSPDGQTIAFVQGSGERIELCTVASLGGAVRTVFLSKDLIEGVAWLTGERGLIFSARDPQGGSRKLMILNLDSLVARGLPASLAMVGEDFLPRVRTADGKLVWIHQDPGGEYSLCESLKEQPVAQRILEGRGGLAGVSWLPADEGLVYSAMSEGLFKLWSLKPGSGQPQLLNTGQGSALNPTVSGRSGNLAFEQVRMARNLMMIKVLGVQPWQLQSLPFAPSTRWEYSATFSPDGTRIALVSDRSGFPEVWLADREGSGLDQITTLKPGFLGQMHWSPQGDRLAFELKKAGHRAIMVLDAAGGRPQTVVQDDQDVVLCGWLPDGKALLIARRGKDGWRLGKSSLNGALTGKWQTITDIPATAGEISSLGGFLYFTRPTIEGLWRQTLEGAEPELIIPNLLPADRANWRLSGDHIAWVERIAGAPYLMWLDLETGTSSMVADLPGLATGGISVAPDGGAFLYVQGTVVAADIMLLSKKAKTH